MSETIQIGPLTIRFLRSRHDTADGLDMFEVDVPPGGTMPVAHYHRNWDETIYGISGTLTMMIDGTRHQVGPGETVFIRRGIVHGFDNRGTAMARCLCVLTPGVLGPEYFRELRDVVAASGGKPDPAAMAAVMQRYGLVPVPG